MAEGRGCSVEELATAVIAEFVGVRANGSPPALDPALTKAVEDSIRENDELYRRLAK